VISLTLLPLAEIDQECLPEVIELFPQTVVLLLQLLYLFLMLSRDQPATNCLRFSRGFDVLLLFAGGSVAAQRLAPHDSVILLLYLGVDIVSPACRPGFSLDGRVVRGAVGGGRERSREGSLFAGRGRNAADRVHVTVHYLNY
jgi:hypothetical protein